ncbi:MAG TPA: hypothetical protein VKA68_03035 [bacterium]|nr:hypothetical protein [bacterium]
MHFIITWEIYAEGEEEKELDQQMKACLDGYNIVQILSTTCVVKVDEQQLYAELHKRWSEVSESNRGKLEFIMSPLMKTGQYAGYFRQEKYQALTSELGSQ